MKEFIKPQSELDNLENLKGNICTEAMKKAKFCTREYKPACAWLDKFDCGSALIPCRVTASNKCMACKVEGAVRYTFGKCTERPIHKEKQLKFTACDSNSKNAEVCPLVFEQKCAWLSENVNCQSDKKPCAVNTSNSCEACRIKEAVNFSDGECPKENVAKDL